MMNQRTENFKEKLALIRFPGMKAHFLRLDRMISMFDHLADRKQCLVCSGMIDEAEKLAEEAVEDFSYDLFESRYLDLYHRMKEHLKNQHGFMMPGYYRNLYGLIMMVVGALAGALLIFMGRTAGLGAWSYETGVLLGWILGLITGMIAGNRKDKELRLKNKIMYQ